MKKAYITALIDQIFVTGDANQALLDIKAVMEKRGHGRLYGAVVRGAFGILEARLKAAQPKVVVAKTDSVSKEALKQALATVGAAATAEPAMSVDPTIIGGFVVRCKDRVLDASYKQSLINLYQSIIK